MATVHRKYDPDRVSDKVEGPFPLRLVRLCLRELYRIIDVVGGSGPGGTIVATDVPHVILDSTVHTDTVTQSVTRGSLIYGNSTPKWDELTVGASSTFLGADGTDTSWRLVLAGYPTFGVDLDGRTYSP